jgi:hypothetical protein
MAVWLKGSGISHDFGCKSSSNPDGGACTSVVTYIEYEDPFGKKIYVAPKANYNQDYFSPTYYMLKKLQTLKNAWKQAQGADKAKLEVEMRQQMEVVDYFRLLYKTYGSIGV